MCLFLGSGSSEPPRLRYHTEHSLRCNNCTRCRNIAAFEQPGCWRYCCCELEVICVQYDFFQGLRVAI